MTPTAAHPDLLSSITLDVPAFDRIELRDPVNLVQLIAEPGETHAVVVDGPVAILRRVRGEVRNGTLLITLSGGLADRLRDAVTTSIGRSQLECRVRAPQLWEVRVAGYASVTVDAFGADAPVVTRLEPRPPAAPVPPR